MPSLREKKELHLQRLRKERVEEVMRKHPLTIAPDTPLSLLLTHILKGEEFLPVVEGGKLVGVVTESDIFQLFMPRLQRPVVGKPELSEARVVKSAGEIMTRRPVTARPGMSLQEALNLMLLHKFRHLPVTKNGELVGVLSLRNLLKRLSG
jgi:CBS domain-containing protein